MRLGVALLIPEPLAGEVDGLRRALGDPALGRVPAHLTLVPPVNVRDEDLGAALARLREAARTRPLSLILGPVDTFWPESPVLYLGVGGPDMARLERLREQVLRPPLRRDISWPFVPHVTVCDDAVPDRIPPAVAALASYRTELVVDRVHMLQERRYGSSRVWEPVADAALAPPAVVGRGGLPVELSVTQRPDPDVAAWAGTTWLAYRRDVLVPARAPVASFAVTARREGAVVGLAEGWMPAPPLTSSRPLPNPPPPGEPPPGEPPPSTGGACRLSRLIVGADERSQGVGSHLLAAVTSLAAESGCDVLRVEVVSGSRAEGFFRSRGFAVTAPAARRSDRGLAVLERWLAGP